jgi:hypothetical protein
MCKTAQIRAIATLHGPPEGGCTGSGGMGGAEKLANFREIRLDYCAGSVAETPHNNALKLSFHLHSRWAREIA